MPTLRFGLPSLIVVLLSLGLPATALADVDLMSPGGFLFDIDETRGTLGNGSIDAYDTCYRLTVNSTSFSPSGTHTTSMMGRQVETPTHTIGTLDVRRMIYVPSTAPSACSGTTGCGDYGRYVDVFENTGTTDVMVTAEYYCNLGSDSSTVINATSSGDMSMGTDDEWIATDDSSDGSGDPSLAHVLQGVGGLVRTSSVSAPFTGSIEWDFSFTVPAGGQAAILTFGVQTMNRAASTAEAARIVDLPSDTVSGIDGVFGDIQNFPVGGAPLIYITRPATVDEGEAITFEVEVMDREGDPVSWSWDLDDDGTFGEMMDAMMYTYPADMTDGDSTVRVGVEASDGMETRTRYVTTEVVNLEPTITSSPPTSMDTFIGAEYRYEITVDDPAGDLDPPGYALPMAPDGMTVDPATGILTWTPTSDQRDMTFTVELVVDDGDDGTDMQTWDLHVSNNRAPEAPTPIRPIERERVSTERPSLVVGNGSDPDGDALVYFFRVDNVSSLDSPALQESTAVAEQAEQTAWTVERPISEGVWYWEAWASDGLAESPHRFGVFTYGVGGGDDGGMGTEDGGMGGADGGSIPPPPGGGSRERSSCSAVPGAGGAPVWGVLGVVAAGLITRRRRRPGKPDTR